MEDEVRTVKALAYRRIQEQNPDYRKNMIEGVCKPRNAEVAAQRTADTKKHKLIASREDLKRFEAMLVRKGRPWQCAHNMYVLQNNSQSKVMTSHNSSGSKPQKLDL